MYAASSCLRACGAVGGAGLRASRVSSCGFARFLSPGVPISVASAGNGRSGWHTHGAAHWSRRSRKKGGFFEHLNGFLSESSGPAPMRGGHSHRESVCCHCFQPSSVLSCFCLYMLMLTNFCSW